MRPVLDVRWGGDRKCLAGDACASIKLWTAVYWKSFIDLLVVVSRARSRQTYVDIFCSSVIDCNR